MALNCLSFDAHSFIYVAQSDKIYLIHSTINIYFKEMSSLKLNFEQANLDYPAIQLNTLNLFLSNAICNEYIIYKSVHPWLMDFWSGVYTLHGRMKTFWDKVKLKIAITHFIQLNCALTALSITINGCKLY